MFGLATHIGTLILALAAPAGEGGEKPDDAATRAAPVSMAPDHADQDFTIYYQARVEGRVTIRITPRRSGGRTLSSLPTAPMSREMRTVPIARCMPLSNLAGVQVARNNTLLLFLRDRRVVMANLERSCRARDYYSGFYVSPSEDGQICVDRDLLQSRTGAKCKVAEWQGLEMVRE